MKTMSVFALSILLVQGVFADQIPSPNMLGKAAETVEETPPVQAAIAEIKRLQEEVQRQNELLKDLMQKSERQRVEALQTDYERVLKALAETRQKLIEVEAENRELREENKSLRTDKDDAEIRTAVMERHFEQQLEERYADTQSKQESLSMSLKQIDAMLGETVTTRSGILGRQVQTVYAVQGKARQALVAQRRRIMFLRSLVIGFRIGLESLQKQGGVLSKPAEKSAAQDEYLPVSAFGS